jgi:arsenate reductase
MSNKHKTALIIYGIRNCDSCRRALKWLEAREVPFTFHDFRLDGLDQDRLKTWLESEQAPYLLNKRSTSWRNLSEEQKQAAEADPLPLMLDHPTLIKRPVISDGKTILSIGFSAAHMEDII